jgi:predicted RNA polymerase sigma factor
MAKADLLEKLGRPEEALAVYDQVIGIDSRGVHAIYMAYVAKAGLLDRLERPKQAQKVREEKERREEEDSIF